MKQSLGVARWVYHEFITAESRHWTGRMLVSLAISVTALNGIAWLAKYLVDGLIRHDAHAVKMSFIGMAVFVVIYGYSDRLQMIAREYAQGANLAQLKRWEHERWEKIERVKTCAKEGAEIAYQNRSFLKVLGEERKFWLWFIGKVTWRGYSNRFVLLGALGYGAWLIWRGDWSNGVFVPLLMYATKVSESIWHIGHIEHQVNWNMPAIRTAMLTLTVPPDITDKAKAIELQRKNGMRVEMRNVSFAYATEKCDLPGLPAATNGGAKPATAVLRNVSLTIAPGEKAALIGPSGAGKTTIMRLLMRYMDPTSGTMLVDGHDLRDVRLSSWLNLIAYVPQQAQVFDGTIRHNLLYRFTDEPINVPDQELWGIMRKLKIDFGDRLTDGLDTRVGRHGIELSGGEQQRLMIGAAGMRKPIFMVVDEATAPPDATTERAVQTGLG